MDMSIIDVIAYLVFCLYFTGCFYVCLFWQPTVLFVLFYPYVFVWIYCSVYCIFIAALWCNKQGCLKDNETGGDIRLKGERSWGHKGHSGVQTPYSSLCNT